MSRSLRRLVPLLLPVMESAVTSAADDSKACMEVGGPVESNYTLAV